MPSKPRAVAILNGVALALLLLAIALAPVPLGSDTQWAQSMLFAVVAVAATLWVVGGVVGGSLRTPRSYALVFVAVFLLIGLLQIVPLPLWLLDTLSPNMNALRAQALGPEEPAGPATLSLHPYVTQAALFRYGACAMVFILLASLVRTRRTLTWAVALLLAAGLFQVIYAMVERASESGGHQVFWVVKREYQATFTGTFLNKNHFAGLLEMVLPLGAALVIAVRGGLRTPADQPISQRIVGIAAAPSTQKRVVLALVPLLLAVGVALSLSRSGVVCSVVALSLLVILAVVRGGRRTSTVLVCVLVAVCAVALVFVSGPLIGAFEREFLSRTPSLTARLDMLRSAGKLIRDFPLVGTGLGTLESVFGRYQSPNLGNIHVNYLANDWAQITCEAGLAGLLAVAAGLCLFIGQTVVRAMRRTSRYCKWVSVGCLMGVLAMCLHSFTDFNLIRTPSNALLFAALLALAHSAAYAERRPEKEGTHNGYRELQLGRLPLRAGFSLLLIVPLVSLTLRQVALATADIRFNLYLHAVEEPTGLYYFLPLPKRLPDDARASARFDLEEALRLAPGNPAYAHAFGQARLEEINRRVGQVAEAIVRRQLTSQGLDPEEEKRNDPDAYEQWCRIFETAAQKALADEIKQDRLLDEAEASFRRAIRLAPTVPRYHLSLAEALLVKSRIAGELGPQEARLAARQEWQNELERTVYFARNTPYLLYDTAHVILKEAADVGGSRRQRGVARATQLLRRAIYGAPLPLAPKAYELLAAAGVDHQGMIEATPKTVQANRYLCRLFWNEKDWEDVVTVLDRLEALAGASGREGEEDEVDAASAEGRGDRPAEEPSEKPGMMPLLLTWARADAQGVKLRLDLAEKRATALGLLGRWDDRAEALAQRSALVKRHVKDTLDDAATMSRKGRQLQALRAYADILKADPHNIDALIGIAGVTTAGYYRDQAGEFYAPLACLFRLVTNNESLAPEQCDRVTALLRAQGPPTSREKTAASFIECTAIMLQSNTAPASESRTAAVRRLEKLLSPDDRDAATWRQRHLIWYYLGVAYEGKGDATEATRMFSKALVLVPNHRRSLVALVRLARNMGDEAAAEQYAARLAALSPAHRCTTTFGGMLKFLGYSVEPTEATEATTPGDGLIRYYWEFLEPVPTAYEARTYFLDRRWRISCVDFRAIAPVVGAYPSELARSGEVIVETRKLPAPSSDAVYLGVGMHAKSPPKGCGEWLDQNVGRGLARFRFVGPASR